MPYETRVSPVQAMSMGDLKVREYYRAQVVHVESGDVAWTSDCYSTAKAARLQANRQRPRFDAYLARTGVRWEVEQREKREDFKRRKREAIEARKAVREAAPALLAALQEVAPDHPALAGLSFPEIPSE